MIFRIVAGCRLSLVTRRRLPRTRVNLGFAGKIFKGFVPSPADTRDMTTKTEEKDANTAQLLQGELERVPMILSKARCWLAEQASGLKAP